MLTRLLGPMLLAAVLPLSPVSTPPRVAAADQSIVLAGGCFWGVEAVFEHVKGVKSVVSGYAGGTTTAPTYELVSSGRTGHAEAVRVVFDPAQVTVEQLLEVFFMVAHDPTQLNRQGPDVGTQYRSAIFFSGPAQQRAAQAYVGVLTQKKVYPKPVVTEIVPLATFYAAEDYHQGYLAQHPYQPYIIINDAPKLEHLKRAFPALYRATTPAE